MEKVLLMDLQKKGLISTRLFNTLLREYFRIGLADSNANDASLQDILQHYSSREIKQFRNMGQATYEEFEKLCKENMLFENLSNEGKPLPCESLRRISERINAIEITPDTEWKELYQLSASIINEELEKFDIDKIKTFS